MQEFLSILLSRLIRYFTRLDRIGRVWYAIVLYIAIVIVTVFGYTVMDHVYYKEAADWQQKAVIKNPSSRWTIYSSEESLGGVLWVSTNLGTLAIDPTQSWARDKLWVFLADVIFEEFCEHARGECVSNMGSYMRTDLSTEKNITEVTMKKKIQEYITQKMDSPIESVDVAGNLDEITIERIKSLSDVSLFFVVNNLYVNPTKVANPQDLANRLAPILQVSEESLKQKFAIRTRRHLEIIRKMNIGTRDMVTKRIDSEMLAVRNKQIDPTQAIFPFIKIEDNLVRYYPEGNTISQITGFVDGEWKWRYGIEWYFDGDLQIESPTQVVVKDIAGRPIRDYVSNAPLTLRSGVDMTLTIDRNLQKEIAKRLKDAVLGFRANKGSVVVMNPKTGAIIAMVNYPDFSPNSFTDVYEMERVLYTTYPNPIFDLWGQPLFIEDTMSGSFMTNIEGNRIKLREAWDDEIMNFAITKYKYKNRFWVGVYKNDVVSALYEPGSVFKAITTAIGIDTGEIKPDDTYYDRGKVELDIGNNVKIAINNLASQCSGMHTYIHALDWSCNVGMIDIVQKIGKALFYQYVQDFWFSSKSNITLDGETYAMLSPYEKWPKVQFFNMSFGQGINVTMLQMAAAYSVLANGWVYMQPYIVEAMTYPEGKKVQTVPTPLRRVIKEETAKQVTAMLIDSVKNGFAKAGGVPGYIVAGKTGTSQIPMRGGYENRIFKSDLWHTITSYGGYAPANNPKFVMIVMIDRPRSSTYSEFTSSALFANISKYLLEYYKVPKNN
jgi:cell division protein FtsI/penicillin-binding protein 2